MVMGMQNYYRIATNTLANSAGQFMTVITNRLKGICKKGRKLTPTEKGTIWQIGDD